MYCSYCELKTISRIADIEDIGRHWKAENKGDASDARTDLRPILYHCVVGTNNHSVFGANMPRNICQSAILHTPCFVYNI